MVALLTWQLPKESLEGKALEHFLAPLRKTFSDPENYRIIEGLARGLLHSEPQDRPRPTTVKRTLENVLNRLTIKPEVGFKVTESARIKVEKYGMTISQFFEDLNDYPVAEYQENERDGEKKTNVVFYGRSVMALSVTDFSNPEQLVLVDVRIDQPEFHRRRRESDTVHLCPYELVEGKNSAFNLLNEFYEYFRFDSISKQRYEAKEDLLEAGLFILDRLENDAVELVITYRQRNKQSDDDILTVEVVNVISSNEDGVETIEALDDELISEWISELGESTSFGLQRQGQKGVITIGTLRNYNRYTRELSLRTRYQGTIPPQGRLVCQNVAQLSSNRRQRDAVDRFLADNTVNQQLGELLLKPGKNSIGERKPLQLIQRLEPQQAVLSIIERALAAEDFFLVQGPPGTGKTTLIAEFVMQVLKANPEARILLTSQANPAVDNAMNRIRDLIRRHNVELRTLRLTRALSKPGTNEFEDSFSTWVGETRKKSQEGLLETLSAASLTEQEKIAGAVENWQTKLNWAVQVYGVTCLRAPTLWELLRKVEFDWIIVDEAAKATDTEILVPLVHGKRFLMVGDQRQLPPYIDTEIEREMRYQGISGEEARSSLFEKTFTLLPPASKAVLQRQYRMHRTIGNFVGRLFYSDIGGLETGVADEERSLEIDYLKKYEHRVLWFDVENGKEERQKSGTSFFNRSEANKINVILEMFNANLARKGIVYTLGVITPYSAQVDVLQESLVPSAKAWTNLKIEVSTVDAFQGRENDITVYSMVRTKPGGLSFVDDEKRLNVSFSRAKRALLVFGHRATASRSRTFSRALKLIPEENVLTGG